MNSPSLRARWILLLGLAVLYSLAHFAYSVIYSLPAVGAMLAAIVMVGLHQRSRSQIPLPCRS